MNGIDIDKTSTEAAEKTEQGKSAEGKPKRTALDRADLILTVIAAICGTFTLAVFGSYFVKIMIFPEGRLPVIACVLMFAWLALPLVFRRLLRSRAPKVYLWLKAFYTLTLVAFTVSYVAVCAYILVPRAETPYDELPEKTVVVTFGAKVNANGSPGTPLARRLRKTAEILDACPTAVCIVSGGKGDDEPVSEAQAMKNWLVSAGIDESRIYIEDRSRNTLQNVSYSRELIGENGLSDYDVACVSSDFHVSRIRFISERTGGFGDHFYRAGGLRAFDWEYFGLAREYLSFVRLMLLGTDG